MSGEFIDEDAALLVNCSSASYFWEREVIFSSCCKLTICSDLIIMACWWMRSSFEEMIDCILWGSFKYSGKAMVYCHSSTFRGVSESLVIFYSAASCFISWVYYELRLNLTKSGTINVYYVNYLKRARPLFFHNIITTISASMWGISSNQTTKLDAMCCSRFNSYGVVKLILKRSIQTWAMEEPMKFWNDVFSSTLSFLFWMNSIRYYSKSWGLSV